jgi:hypothetical protein
VSQIELAGEMSCTAIEGLPSDHEEVDTRMIAHAKHASLSYSNVILRSPDTNVFVIALNASRNIHANMFFETGKGSEKRIITLSEVRERLGNQWCSEVGFHAFTGRCKPLFCLLTQLFLEKHRPGMLFFLLGCYYKCVPWQRKRNRTENCPVEPGVRHSFWKPW